MAGKHRLENTDSTNRVPAAMLSLPAARFRPRPLVRAMGALLAGCLAWGVQIPPVLAADLPAVLRDQTGRVVRFDGANVPGQPFSNRFGGQSLRIDQFEERATLHWESFDVGENNEVIFNQPSSSAIALNRVLGETDARSIIAGRITANGRVFLINHNGILFGPNSRVNTQSLVASSLDIEDDVFQDIGFVNAINEPQARAAFEAAGLEPLGNIEIAPGAQINAGENGRIMMFAPRVTNGGDLHVPEGQIILAAVKDKVYLADDNGGDSRGLLVEVATGGDVENIGRLVAERGNVSLLGLAVRQSGVIRATTSVSLNGSVRLVAQDMDGSPTFSGVTGRRALPQRAGDLTLAHGSVTEVLPELIVDANGNPVADQPTAPDAQSQPDSRITLRAKQVTLEGGSRITAPGGTVDITASLTPVGSTSQPADPTEIASVHIQSGAEVDTSGTRDTVVSVARNFVTVAPRGNEFADAPLQREGALVGEDIVVDSRKGTKLMNVEGALAALQRDVTERLSTGGEINLSAPNGRVAVSEGARLDISGGQVTYTGDTVASSKLVTLDGKVVDIADADPNTLYQGVLGRLEIEHAKWGVTESYSSPAAAFEPGYVEGKDAGELIISATDILLDGTLVASTVKGRQQRRAPGGLAQSAAAFARPYDQIPLGGRLEINRRSVGSSDLILGDGDDDVPLINNHPDGSAGALVMDPALLTGSGIARIDIDNDAGRVILNRALALPEFGALTLKGSQVLVQADVRTPGGDITLDAGNQRPAPDQTGAVVVDASLDVSGRWTNDSTAVNTGLPTDPIITDGGNITLDSSRDLLLSDGALLDVSGGAHLSADGDFTGGKGGRLALQSWKGRNDNFTSRMVLDGELRGRGLEQGGTLALSAEAIRIQADQVGDANDFTLDGDHFGIASSTVGTWNKLTVSADTFQRGGFQGFELQATRREMEVAADANVQLRAANPILDVAGISASLGQQHVLNDQAGSNGHPAELIASATALADFTRMQVLPDYERKPVDLALSAKILDMNTAARIEGDVGAAVSMRTSIGMRIDGTISTPAGSIDLVNTAGRASRGPLSRIWLGPDAALLAPGAVRIDPVNNLGQRRGEVLDAGRVTVRAEEGSIVGVAGTTINVDAVATTLDIGRNGLVNRRQIAGDAGEINLFVADALLYQGTLSARSAGQRGGQLNITLDPTELDLGVVSPGSTSTVPRGPHTAVMGAFEGTLPAAAGDLDSAVRNTAYVPVDQVVDNGFDGLDVRVRSSAEARNADGILAVPDTPDSLPIIAFDRDTRLTLPRRLVLDAAVLRAGQDVDIELQAPHVALGSSDSRVRLDGSVPDVTSDTNAVNNTQVLRLDPTGGTGSLRVNAELLELVGELTTWGIGSPGAASPGVELLATQDVRMRGVRTENTNTFSGLFRTAGDLRIEAQRVFPTTLSEFELAIEGPGGRLRIDPIGDSSPASPLSVGGGITLKADIIEQGGNLLAPLGTLELDAASALSLLDGSLTSTSPVGVAAPFFTTQPGGDLLLPDPDENEIVFVESVENPGFERSLPRQRLVLRAADIDLRQGSRFDVRGGGDIRSVEFLPGPGGSRDILLAVLGIGEDVAPNPSFAIVPAVGQYAPHDPLVTPAFEQIQGYQPGDTLILEEGMAGLPAGEYAILPARYALFGGFLVTPVDGSRDLASGLMTQRPDGAPVLAGRFGAAGSAIADDRRRGFAIEDGARVRNRAQFLETPLQDQYTADAAGPQGAGTLSIEARSALQLAGRLVPDTGNGRGAQVDIIADRLSIRQRADGGNGIELLTEQLAQLGADSLLIGGRRSVSPDGLVIASEASEVTVDAGVELAVPELILVGDRVIIDSTGQAPTRLISSVEAAGERETLRVAGDAATGSNGDAAVVAVSDRTLTLERQAPTPNATGRIDVTASTELGARGSLILDAEGDVNFAGALDAEGALVNLGASSVSLGETGGQLNLNGLVLSNERLAGLTGANLRLRSSAAVSIFGDIAEPVNGEDIAFEGLTLDAGGLLGVDTDNALARLVAERIRLTNTSGVDIATTAASPSGTLQLAADRLEVGDGRFTISGYREMQLQANSALLLDGEGELRVAGDLTVDAPLITATTGAESIISAENSRLSVTGGDADAALPSETGLAASLRLQGNAIAFGGRAVLPSGMLSFEQTGNAASPVSGDNLAIADAAILDVSGVTLDFGPTLLGTPGGVIRLHAQTGDIELGTASRFDVSASSFEADAGELHLTAPLGRVRVAATTQFLSGEGSGSLFVDAARLDVGGDAGASAYTGLNALLGADGFATVRDVRLRGQSLLLEAGAILRAHQIRAVSDTGDVVVRGRMDASGFTAVESRRNGGSLLLAAGDRLDIEAGAVLKAAAAVDGDGNPLVGAKGGQIELVALDPDGSDSDGLTDRVNLHAGAVIDLTGGVEPVAAQGERLVSASQQLGGTLRVHTRRLDTDGDFQTDTLVLGDLNATVTGAKRAELVATHVVRHGEVIGLDGSGSPVVFDLDRDRDGDGVMDDASITTADQQAAATDTADFLARAAKPAGALQVAPGLVLESPGDIVLEDAWDFCNGCQNLTAPRVAGVLTLRAAGDLDLQADLTDSFFDKPSEIFGPFVIPALPARLAKGIETVDAAGNPVILAPAAWTFNLTAGADTQSADLSAVRDGNGDLALAEQVALRTGTGDISVAAGRDILLASGSAILTAGYERGIAQTIRDVIPAQGALDAEFKFNKWMGGGANFPVDGGNVRVRVGGNVTAAAEQASPTEWLTRIGEARKGVVALAQDAGAVPTQWGIAFHRFTDGIGALGGGELQLRTGGDLSNVALAIPTTGRTVAGAVKDADEPTKFGVALETTEIAGGGQLHVDVGGDLRGGSLLLGDGAAQINVSGDVVDSSSGTAPGIYVGGDARFQLTTAGSLTVGGIQDPTTVALSPSQGVNLTAAQPKVYLDNLFYTFSDTARVDIRALSGDVLLPSSSGFDKALPPDLLISSVSRDIRIEEPSLAQFPSQQGQLTLLAGDSITGSDGTALRQSDSDPALQARIDVPTETANIPDHAQVPLHADDPFPNLFVARDGSIAASGDRPWRISLAKASIFSAGLDIKDLRAEVQNVRPQDVTTFEAGRDIVQSTQREPTGTFKVSGPDSGFSKFEISGPGAAQFVAGRSIALGTSQGIESVGNVDNSALADNGARLQLLAGLGGAPDVNAFIQRYLVETNQYAEKLADFLDSREVAISGADPVLTFRNMDRREQRLLVADILFDILRETGVEAESSGTGDFSRGFEAIETLFPQNDPDGGISMLLSQVQTLDGGSIDLLVPGGLINAGAADADIIQKNADELGIVAARDGDINVFVDGDFLVNSTRAFALQGDLLVWSSNGSIDAGRGAKTVTSIPDPITRIDAQTGQTIIEFPPAVEGSGLQGVNAFLFAPRGVINAGDAGIRTSGDLTLSATEVIGADNIDVGGVAVGVPVGNTGVGASFAGASNVASAATNQAVESTGSIGSGGDGAQEEAAVGVLSVQVVGFGDCPASDPTCER